MKLQKYDIILCKPRKVTSKIVAFLLGQKYCHVCIYIGNYHCIEANITGVKIKEFNNRLGDFDIYRTRAKLSRYQEEVIEEFLLRQINKPYNIFTAIGSVFNCDSSDQDTYVCYSLIARALKQAKIKVAKYDKAFDKLTNSSDLRRIKWNK